MDVLFSFSVLKPFKPNELLVLCFVTLHTLILSCPHLCSEHLLKRTFGPTGSLLYFLCFFSSLQPQKSHFYLSLLCPCEAFLQDKAPEAKKWRCVLSPAGLQRGRRGGQLHTPVPLAPGGELGWGRVCLPTRSQNNFSVEPIRSKTSNSVEI